MHCTWDGGQFRWGNIKMWRKGPCHTDAKGSIRASSDVFLSSFMLWPRRVPFKTFTVQPYRSPHPTSPTPPP